MKQAITFYFKTLLVLVFIGLPVLLATHLGMISSYQNDIDPRVQDLYSQFIKEGKKRNVVLSSFGVSMKFVPSLPKPNQKPQSETLASCSIILGMKPTIQINTDQWYRFSDAHKEAIIFHELGHCFLLKGHNNRLDKHDQNLSLMAESIMPLHVYLEKREQYLDELFSYRPYHAKDYVETFFAFNLFGKR